MPKVFVGEPYSAVIQKKYGREKVYGKEAGRGGWDGRVSRFSADKFLPHSAATFRKGTFLCCVSVKLR